RRLLYEGGRLGHAGGQPPAALDVAVAGLRPVRPCGEQNDPRARRGRSGDDRPTQGRGVLNMVVRRTQQGQGAGGQGGHRAGGDGRGQGGAAGGRLDDQGQRRGPDGRQLAPNKGHMGLGADHNGLQKVSGSRRAESQRRVLQAAALAGQGVERLGPFSAGKRPESRPFAAAQDDRNNAAAHVVTPPAAAQDGRDLRQIINERSTIRRAATIPAAWRWRSKIVRTPPIPNAPTDAMSIPFIDLQAQRLRIADRIDAAVTAAVHGGQWVMGPQVREFEQKLAAFGEAKHALGCGNGTDALALPLMAWGLGLGDAVFVPSFTFAATAEVVPWFDAEPVFVDIDPDTYNMDPAHLEAAIEATRAEGRLT